MSVSPSLGTNFGDNVRVGPGMGILNKAQGSQLAPISIYDIAPEADNNENIVLATVTAGAGYLTLAAAPDDGTTQVSKFGLTNVIQLDVPRAFSATLTAGAGVGNLIVTGYDMYLNKMQEQITTVAATTVNGQKAFKWIISAYYSNITGPGETISVGTANIFGLPWRVDSSNYIFAKFGDNLQIPTPITGNATLGAGGTTSVSMPGVSTDSVVIVSATNINGGTQGMLIGDVQNVAGVNTLVITSSSAADISLVSYMVSYVSPQVLFTPAYQDVDGNGNPEPSTATSADVRGTVSVVDEDISPDGEKRLTVFAYVLGSNTTALIDPSIQVLDEYAYKTIPNPDTLQGYAQFAGT